METLTTFGIYVVLQFILFIPFFLIWKKDCKKFGKENLAVSLKERFVTWLILSFVGYPDFKAYTDNKKQVI